MIFYRLLLVIVGLFATIVVFFFAWGVVDGTVGADNILLWLFILGAVGAVIWGGRKLRGQGQTGAASLVLLLLALPAFAIGLFILLALILQPRWN
jgi:hypothetical protein